jgi:tape measure domain-containing protein
MPDILASVSVALGAEISGFKAAMAEARRELRGLVQFSEGLKDIGQTLTTSVSLPIAALGTAAVAASAKMESLSKGLQAIAAQDVGKQGATGLDAMRQAAQQTTERLAVLQEIAKAPGIGFEEAVRGDIRLRAVGISAQQSAVILREFANAIALTGGGASELNSVTVQLAQLSAKGKVLAQDLRPIIEAAPSVATALQKLFGTVDSETISDQLAKAGQSSSDFIARLTDELAKAPRVTGGLGNAFENFSQTATQSFAKIGDAISQALGLPAVLESLSNGVERLGNFFANLSPGVQKAIVVLGGIAAAAGPVLVAIGSIGAALPAIQAGFAVFGTTAAAALGPLTLVIGAVAGAALLIYENWDSLVSYFQGPDGQVFSDLGTAIGEAFSAIGAAIGALARGPIGQAVAAFVRLQLAFDGKVLQAAVAVVSGALSFLAGNVRVVTDLFTGNFQQALADAANTARSVLKPFQDLLGLGSQSNTTFGEFFKDILPAAQQATQGIDYFSDAITGLGKQQGLLEALKLKLKEVQEQREKETSATAVAADNAQIKSLQVQIDKLEGVDKSSKKATDAITKLRQELAGLSALDGLLGNTPTQLEILERRRAALESGLKNLVSAGISPASAAFRGFAVQAVQAGQAMDTLLATSQLEVNPIDLKLKVTIGDFNPSQLQNFSQELLDRPVLVPFKLEPLKSDFSGDFLKANQDISRGLAEASANAAAFGGSFDFAGARVEVLRNALQNLVASGVPATSAGFKQLSQDLAQSTTLYNLNTSATAALTSGLSQLATGLLNSLGQLAVGNLSLEAFGATLLGLVGKLATQLGEAIVAVGIGMLGLKTAFTNPFGAIAAGAALIVVGAALSSIASSAANSGGGSANISTAVPSAPRTFTPAAQAQAPAPVTITHKVIMQQRGADLVGALDIQTTRNGRSYGGG